MDNTRDARSVNQNATILSVAMEAGGGYIPDSGSFSSKVWARLIGVDEKTIRRWIGKHKIPFRQPGAEMFVSAVDLLAHVPYHNRPAKGK